ncbi:putative pre-mrna-splicing factor 38b [Diplodia seriata]|uniref:Putative pre-mrna-splicing factor 38b n=1 Tax=Diplodia seriata TaxID=420778 RepID=A0A0G2ELQ4_9PEZI|nr:putative pre-mrna-splicing factor 38b [Diplodia seriata]
MDLASSLTQEEIPIKLRCAICNKLVVNAFGLPCCDQSICGNCQSALPDSCPVCSHSPLSADDCKPKKNLRLTVKAYLKSEEKKRDKERSVSIAAKPDTPVTPGGTAPAVVQSIEQPLDAPDNTFSNAPPGAQELKDQEPGDGAQASEAPQLDTVASTVDQAQNENPGPEKTRIP